MSKDEARGPEAVALLGGLALFVIAVVYAYNLGYADGARQAAPLAAPPTHAERAR
jgi:hypothetical protein